MKRITILLIVLSLFTQALAADDITTSNGLTLLISSLPEAKLIVSQSFTVPFLQGEGAMVKNNNVKFSIDAEITPISMGLLGGVIFTPIAFIEIAAGGLIGSGWNIELFGSEVRGIGANVSDNGKTSVDGSAFDGTFMGAHFGGAFQFDLAAVLPGDWNHVLFRSYHEANCRIYSRAGRGDSWFYESDHGENQNGWNYYGNYLIGYQMPIFLNMVALLAETEKYLYNTPDGDLWGDSLGRWDFGLITNFKITDKFSTALITQFRLYRNYSNFTYNNKDKDDSNYNRYYRDRMLDDGRSLKFYRVAAILNYKLR